ncbi:hypothetical protein GXP70_17230 [Paenibacillus lycopersici]|uniref:Uncharacterized protein n=1 Tax=Paenibacillus lycopersici TaxID=2704462 RepID=A0A6C0FXW3_9BACL|nr:hypothetical protein [Paenibacillus lycopersici]QHT61537.1 hypothetical protein GXP70_17230 [Paenibacillus lycopersici]
MILDIGCGLLKRPDHYGIDRSPLPGVNMVGDLNASCNGKKPRFPIGNAASCRWLLMRFWISAVLDRRNMG